MINYYKKYIKYKSKYLHLKNQIGGRKIIKNEEKLKIIKLVWPSDKTYPGIDNLEIEFNKKTGMYLFKLKTGESFEINENDKSNFSEDTLNVIKQQEIKLEEKKKLVAKGREILKKKKEILEKEKLEKIAKGKEILEILKKKEEILEKVDNDLLVLKNDMSKTSIEYELELLDIINENLEIIKNNVFLIEAHGKLIDEIFIVPDDMYIVFHTGSGDYLDTNFNSFLNKNFISQELRHYVRIYKPGDIIYNLHLSLFIDWYLTTDLYKYHELNFGGLINYYDFNLLFKQINSNELNFENCREKILEIFKRFPKKQKLINDTYSDDDLIYIVTFIKLKRLNFCENNNDLTIKILLFFNLFYSDDVEFLKNQKLSNICDYIKKNIKEKKIYLFVGACRCAKIDFCKSVYNEIAYNNFKDCNFKIFLRKIFPFFEDFQKKLYNKLYDLPNEMEVDNDTLFRTSTLARTNNQYNLNVYDLTKKYNFKIIMDDGILILINKEKTTTQGEADSPLVSYTKDNIITYNTKILINFLKNLKDELENNLLYNDNYPACKIAYDETNLKYLFHMAYQGKISMIRDEFKIFTDQYGFLENWSLGKYNYEEILYKLSLTGLENLSKNRNFLNKLNVLNFFYIINGLKQKLFPDFTFINIFRQYMGFLNEFDISDLDILTDLFEGIDINELNKIISGNNTIDISSTITQNYNNEPKFVWDVTHITNFDNMFSNMIGNFNLKLNDWESSDKRLKFILLEYDYRFKRNKQFKQTLETNFITEEEINLYTANRESYKAFATVNFKNSVDRDLNYKINDTLIVIPESENQGRMYAFINDKSQTLYIKLIFKENFRKETYDEPWLKQI